MKRTPALVTLMLTLPDTAGWHDRLRSYTTPRGGVTYVYHARLGAPPMTQAALETALTAHAGSLDAVEVAGRREMRRGWR